MSRIRAAFLESAKERVRFSSGNLPKLSENQLGSPDLSLTPQSISSDEFEPNSTGLISKKKWSVQCCFAQGHVGYATYSLISFSLSYGLLGVLDVFE